MRYSALLAAPIFAAAALAQSSTGDDFPQTTFLQQTNSLGVVTGQPAPATSIPDQPSAVTTQPPQDLSQPPVETIPAVGTGVNTILIPGPSNTTRTLTVSANNSTTVILSPTRASTSNKPATGTDSAGRPTGTDSNGNPTTGTAADSTASATSTGAAATMKAMAGSVIGIGAFAAAFL